MSGRNNLVAYDPKVAREAAQAELRSKVLPTVLDCNKPGFAPIVLSAEAQARRRPSAPPRPPLRLHPACAFTRRMPGTCAPTWRSGGLDETRCVPSVPGRHRPAASARPPTAGTYTVGDGDGAG